MPKSRPRSRSRERHPKHSKRSRSRSRESRHRKHKRERRSKSPESRSSYYEDRSRKQQESKSTTKPEKDFPKPSRVFSFADYRYELDVIFFGNERDVIKKGTQQYDDFWNFFAKYQMMQVKQGAAAWTPPNASINELDVPLNFHRSFLINFKIKLPGWDTLMSRLPPLDYEGDEEEAHKRELLTKERLMEFRSIIELYLDFRQREKFAKIRRLRESQVQLPIAQYREEIVNQVKNNQVVIIAGDTGCGKSTQVPQYLLQTGFTNIACTQPRRIACISLSKRVAYETLNEYGSEVGYQIRFERHKTQHTRIVFVTEGLLLRQISSDPMLSSYNIIVLDEVHERHLAGDFLLGVVKCLLQARTDIKLVLMSATININLFQDYFKGQAPVIQVPGRLYPIQVQYHPIIADERVSKTGKLNPTPYIRILQLIDHKYPKEERGDLLIFLSGMNEISTVVDAAREYAQQNKRWIVLSLHSSLSLAEQDKVFDYPPDGVRKCIVSTNIAETSVTIDGVRFVADSGKVKEMSFDPASKLQKLQEFWISRASAEQRKGRAGRTGPGVCFRLYTEKEYGEFAAYSAPEIQRVPLDSMILQMISMGLPDARRFPFIEPPSIDSIENSITSLREKGALTIDEKLTPIGECLSGLPVDVTLGKMLLMGSVFRQVEVVLALAAALSVQSPFTNKSYRDPDCENARRELDSDHGEPFTLLNAYRTWLEIKSQEDGAYKSKKWCKRRGLEEQRFYEMTKLRQQFREILKDSGLLPSDAENVKSSAQRSARHGELKHLKSLKRDIQRAAPRQRKLLKIGEGEVDDADLDDEEAAGNQVDLRDVEFRIQHDSGKVRELLKSATAESYEDVMLLKMILCSGLCPQVALSDEHNNYKSSSDQFFHTRAKPFTVPHPMSVFATQPEILQLSDSDIIDIPGWMGKHRVSSKHQLLIYVTLLETNKPYLVNCLRMPAVQTLLLFSQSIDTSSDFSRIVCDSWLEIRFVEASAAQSMILRAAKLRYEWNNFLLMRLEASKLSIKDAKKSEERANKLQRKISHDLVAFAQSQVLYSIKRLLAGDLKVLYVGPEAGIPGEDSGSGNPFWPGFEPDKNQRKGGLQLADFLTYACLEDPDVSQDYLSMPWMCPHCEKTFYLTGLGRLRHQVECSEDKTQAETAEGEEPARAKGYYCPECKETLDISGIELLRHKKKHIQDKQSVE